MAIRSLVIAPDPLLKQVSAPVETVNAEIRALLQDLLDTMYHAGGIGLSAVQIGQLKRLVVVDVEQDERGIPAKPIMMVNPEIVQNSTEESRYNEGCLSFPDQFADVMRPKAVTVRYLDENGAPQTLEADGLLATCLQHEIDHCNGIVFVDHISSLKRDMILRRMKKGKKLGLFDDHSQCGHHHHGHDHHHDHGHVHGPDCNH